MTIPHYITPILLAFSITVTQLPTDTVFKKVFDQIGYVVVEENNSFNWYNSSWENSSGDELFVNLIDCQSFDGAKHCFQNMLFDSDEPSFDGNFSGRVIQIYGAKNIDDERDPYRIIIWKNHFVIDINFLGSLDIGLKFEKCCIDKVLENYSKQDYSE